MKSTLFLLLTLLLLLSSCGVNVPPASNKTYEQIDQETAKEMMTTVPDIVILDVREQAEYNEGHIPGAVLLSVSGITGHTASAAIPQKDTVVLVYCRSGNRSKTASAKLVELGYTQIYEFGGIITWPYEITRE